MRDWSQVFRHIRIAAQREAPETIRRLGDADSRRRDDAARFLGSLLTCRGDPETRRRGQVPAVECAVQAESLAELARTAAERAALTYTRFCVIGSLVPFRKTAPAAHEFHACQRLDGAQKHGLSGPLRRGDRVAAVVHA